MAKFIATDAQKNAFKKTTGDIFYEKDLNKRKKLFTLTNLFYNSLLN